LPRDNPVYPADSLLAPALLLLKGDMELRTTMSSAVAAREAVFYARGLSKVYRMGEGADLEW